MAFASILWQTGAGVAMFWALALGIVIARVIYIEPGLRNGFDYIVALARSLIAMLCV